MLIRPAALILTAMLIAVAAPALAHPPDPANCQVPDLITMVGRGPGGGADPLGTFTVLMRDFNNVPEDDYGAVLDFSRCPDIRICADQDDPLVVVDCAAKTVRLPNNGSGEMTFRVLGSAINSGASPGSTGPCLWVWASRTGTIPEIFLKEVRVAALDQDGIEGVNGEDLSLFLADYFSGQSFARSDYDGNGAIDGGDLSLWLAAHSAGGSAVSGGTACP